MKIIIEPVDLINIRTMTLDDDQVNQWLECETKKE